MTVCNYRIARDRKVWRVTTKGSSRKTIAKFATREECELFVANNRGSKPARAETKCKGNSLLYARYFHSERDRFVVHLRLPCREIQVRKGIASELTAMRLTIAIEEGIEAIVGDSRE